MIVVARGATRLRAEALAGTEPPESGGEMSPEEAHTAEGFGIAGTIAFWTSAAGFVIFSVALFHFLS